MRKRIVHLHTDKKFIATSEQLFKSEIFNNEVLYITKRENALTSHKLKNIDYSPTGLMKVLKICKDADMVVVYDLDPFKARLVNMLPKNVKIAWRFFGYELYSRISETCYSNSTKQYLRKSFFNKFKDDLISNLKMGKSYLKWKNNSEKQFLNAINRIDYFLCFYKHERDQLSQFWPNIPEFFQLPIMNPAELKGARSDMEEDKKSKVLLGNNRSAYNNHIDLLKIIKSSKVNEKIKFSLLFNYGPQNRYTQAVLEESQNIDQLSVIKEFMPFEDFRALYNSIGALVINGYRQMAVGNIFLALSNGTKVYLNKKNDFFDWMTENDFKIYSIEDFSRDIETGNIMLSKEDRTYNAQKLQRLFEKRDYKRFQEQLFELI